MPERDLTKAEQYEILIKSDQVARLFLAACARKGVPPEDYGTLFESCFNDLPYLLRESGDRRYTPGPDDMPDNFDPPEGIDPELFDSMVRTIRLVMIREKFGTNPGPDA